MPQKMKLTTDKNARPYQRRRTEALQKDAKDKKQLQSTPPKILKGKARYAYTQLYPVLKESGFITQADIDTVTLFCMQVQNYKDAYQNIVGEGASVKGRPNPFIKTLNDVTKSVQLFADDLGLTPAARARLLETVEQDDGGESMSDLLNKGGDF